MTTISTGNARHDEKRKSVHSAMAVCLKTPGSLLSTIRNKCEVREGKWLTIPDPEHPDDPNAGRKVYDVPSVKTSLR